MPPRKRTSSGCKKSTNQNREQHQQPSQPSKFGIQHFFDRHSQSQRTPLHTKNVFPDSTISANKNPKTEHIVTRNPANDLKDEQARAQDQMGLKNLHNMDPIDEKLKGLTRVDGSITISADDRRPEHILPVVIDEEKNQLEVSPEASKSLCVKRFKFSPVMLIKQSQDDVVDDVTWRISPINERLKKMSKHLLPGTVRVLADSSRFNVMNFQQCSQKKVQISPDMPGKFEKWLSSPPPKTSEKAMISLDRTFLSNVKSEEHDVKFYVNKSITNSNSISEGHNTRSPFSTPPSLSCCPGKADSDAGSHGASDQLGTRQHKKALIELLDQVEDVISVEDSSCEDNRIVSDVDRQIKNNLSVNCLTKNSEQHRCSKDSDIKFLVLEVSAESSGPQSTFKVLRLLNEQSGVERAVRLWDDWYDSIVAPGDTVNVIGGFDAEGKCDVNHEQNFLIVHPDIFVAGTRVSGSISCQRRAILDERLKSSEYSSAALNGTLLHQIFEAGLTSEFPTKEFLEQYARIVLQKNLESLYACGENEYDTLKTLIEAVPKILNWIFCFRDSQVSRSPSVDFENEGPKKIKIAEVVDIEEMAWSPKYGLKGNIDASIRVRTNIKSGEANEIIMPLEFKTGKSTSAATVIEHNAQVILYTLLMSERYMMNIERGLLYNLHTDHTKGIFVGRPGLIGVIKRRNELADELLKALTAQQLPPMRQIPNMCKYCRHLNVCTIYHKAYGGTTKGSGLGEVYDSLVSHLTATHVDFLRKWERLVDLEARHTEALKKECWSWENLRNGNHQNFLSSLVLETPDKSSQQGFCTDNRFVYRFVGLELSLLHPEQLSGISLSPSSCFHDIFKSGEYVTLSTEPVHMLIAKGIIVDIGNFHVSISFAKRLRLPWCNTGAMVNHLHQQHWRIDKDEFMSTFATMRYNIIQLFLQNESSSHLRRMIVDLEIPRFESGCIFSQDPAVSYVCSENSLNDDQRRAILKILAAKDYALILGMPGTGKTTTMVHAVKALLMRGSSILLTSYQNTAVDNLLIKLKAQNIDFVRIGRREVVHEEVQENCLSGMKMNSTEDIEKKMNYTNVVAVTCSGITSSLLSKKKFDVCIMDEAGQITLPISLGPLMFASKFVLVGDPYQLPPIVKSQEAKENGMGKSLFSRLSEAHPQAIAALYSQYRMCSAIMELSNALIYGNRLRCGSSEIENAKLKYKYSPTAPAWLMKVLNPNQSVIFINTDLLPAYESKDGTAVNNKIEAFIIAEVTKAMLLGGISEQEIGIITPYNSQVNLIRGSISEPVEVHTIDKYQGRDKDCILVSFVKSSENPRNNAGLLLGDWHRINVAITRAKKKLIMVGSCKTLAKVPLLKLLIEKVDDLSGLLAFNMNEINYRFEMRRCSEI